MALPKLTKLELRIMEILWKKGTASIREIQEAFPDGDRPAYTTVQTIIYRLEFKKAVRRIKKISNAHIFEAVVQQKAAHRRLIDELLALLGGKLVMAHLVDAGEVTLDDIREAEKALRRHGRKDKVK
jgi:BlaI family transcriptional regulator, penicillinase repressor